MPATEITDLDALVAPDRQVRIGGKVYQVPASPPIEYFLWMRSFVTRFPDVSEEEFDACHARTVELLRLRDPKAKLSDEVTLAQIITFFTLVYLGGAEAAQDPPTKRKAQTRGGAGSGTRSRRSRSST